jgi:hypothetical protein
LILYAGIRELSGHDSDPADIHQFDCMHRADADTGSASHTMVGMHFVMPRHVQQHDRSHVAELGTGTAMLADIEVDHWAVSRDGVLPVWPLELIMWVLKMEQHLNGKLFGTSI